MPIELTNKRTTRSRPVTIVPAGALSSSVSDESALRWAGENRFEGQAGRVLIIPGSEGKAAGALLGVGDLSDAEAALATGSLARDLPAGSWHFSDAPSQPELAVIGMLLGGYRYSRYKTVPDRKIKFAIPAGANAAEAERIAHGSCLARDLINTPASDMGPDALEAEARKLARRHKASVSVTKGDALLTKNFPMIHAVGRASTEAPRLIDLRWGPKSAPKVTLVGKGVCFDTGGLDIKPAAGMLMMKKDMGGAANVLGLAAMIMGSGARIRLRVLIPAVENSIAGNAFRPGDVLHSRKGLTVEIGNTDAEGRLVLADAMALADEEKPQLLIDMATLTGAARIALGPDVPPFYTDDDTLADELQTASQTLADPMWRLPLWRPYGKGLNSKIADINNVTSGGFAGSITAALFLSRFVEKSSAWVHFDIYGWNPVAKPHAPVGGEAQCIRAIYDVIKDRYSG